ncbi:class I SAM-dependent methyltransferase [Sulfurivermis fontis]|uniref:class I SAM-dependent methyltransferase n=1 Tax=Sulfurivermis fontis TaxID=1972068 RepID=UPI000FD8903C|nr:class I SAM-dependent methyltransferase [Sulfurivermis fontis]
MGFKDHFSGHAADYTRYRPGYPYALFAWLAQQAPGHERVWDCATGNGQAALGLAAHFDAVIATDASANQIAAATAHPRVRYAVAPAEASGIAAHSVDLITVGQALHWFDFPAFYAEAARVLKPGGVLAAWSYGLMQISPAVDAAVWRLYEPITGAYWPPERRYVEEQYHTLPFPLDEIAAPSFAMEAQWTLEQLLGYLGTWSAVQRYRKERGNDPLQLIADELAAAWGGADTVRRVVWPLSMRVGRFNSSGV